MLQVKQEPIDIKENLSDDSLTLWNSEQSDSLTTKVS